jgi:hypothetical protein
MLSGSEASITLLVTRIRRFAQNDQPWGDFRRRGPVIEKIHERCTSYLHEQPPGDKEIGYASIIYLTDA